MKKDGLFDPTKKIVRNARLTFEHQGIGEKGYIRWLTGGAYTEDEKCQLSGYEIDVYKVLEMLHVMYQWVF
jgi:hypothetical protein